MEIRFRIKRKDFNRFSGILEEEASRAPSEPQKVVEQELKEPTELEIPASSTSCSRAHSVPSGVH